MTPPLFVRRVREWPRVGHGKEVMNDRYESRRKGCLAHKVDSEALTKHIHKILELTYGKFDGLERCEVEPLVFVTLKDTDSWGKPKVAIIGTEGVGWRSDEDSRIVSVPLWSSNGFSSARPVDLHCDVLATFVTEETVDLADWVRVFGDRLETNLCIWQEAMAVTENASV